MNSTIYATTAAPSTPTSTSQSRGAPLRRGTSRVTYDAEAATLTYDAWSAQEEFLDVLADDATDLGAFLAGYGSGKSVTGARWLLTQAVENPGSRFLAMGIDFTKARDTTFRTLFANLPGDRTEIVTSSFNGPESSPLVADYNRAEHRITLVNDSVITLGSADKWNRYAGAEYGGFGWMNPPTTATNSMTSSK